jgi:A118 family predicted phage portal protein
MNTLWAKIQELLIKLFKKTVIPPEVANQDENIVRWFEVFRCRAPWLKYDYVTSDAVRRTRQRFTLNMAKVACAEMAGLVLAEAPDVKASPLVLDLIRREKLWDNARKSLEYQGALGGQVFKLMINDGQIGLDFVKANNFIPLSWDSAQVNEAAFIDRRVINGETLIRIETHRKATGMELESGGNFSGYVITNLVFEEKSKSDRRLDLFGPNVMPEVYVQTEKPLFAYCRNPEANNVDPESPIGISLYANAMDTLQALDFAFDGFKTEILMGRQRIALPSSVMRGYIDKDTGNKKLGFDPTDEAYIRLEGDDADKFKPTDLTGQLRSEQWKNTIQTLLDIFAVQTGFSAGYFSFDGASVKTATEVISNNSKTYKTMQAYQDNLAEALRHVFDVANELGLLYNIRGAAAVETAIIFDDSVIESRDARAAYWSNLSALGMVDQITALMKIHGINEAAAETMAQKISEKTQKVDVFGTGV